MRGERGIVTISALGDQRFLVRAEGELNEEREVTGHDEALALTGELAARLDTRGDPATPCRSSACHPRTTG